MINWKCGNKLLKINIIFLNKRRKLLHLIHVNVIYKNITLAKQALTRREEIKKRRKEKRIQKRIKKKRRVFVIIDVIIGIFLLFIFPIVIGILTSGYMYTILFILWALPDTGIFLLTVGLGSILAGIFKYKSNAY